MTRSSFSIATAGNRGTRPTSENRANAVIDPLPIEQRDLDLAPIVFGFTTS
jgi:hypothetical protein